MIRVIKDLILIRKALKQLPARMRHDIVTTYMKGNRKIGIVIPQSYLIPNIVKSSLLALGMYCITTKMPEDYLKWAGVRFTDLFVWGMLEHTDAMIFLKSRLMPVENVEHAIRYYIG